MDSVQKQLIHSTQHVCDCDIIVRFSEETVITCWLRRVERHCQHSHVVALRSHSEIFYAICVGVDSCRSVQSSCLKIWAL